MRRLWASLLFLLALSAPVMAQGFIPAQQTPWVYADDYGRWAIRGQATNTFTFKPAAVCQITQLGNRTSPSFYAFSAAVGYAPVLIADVNPSNSEIVTPTVAFTPTQTTCGVTLSAANTHTTFTLQSGSAGLQEALNQAAVSTQPYVTQVLLSREWFKLVSLLTSVKSTVNPATIIYNATGTSKAQLVDVTKSPWVYYTWNGTHYVAAPVNATVPTVTAGAGAGTSPTIAVVGTGLSGNVTLTTGTTPTASGVVFTLTWPAIASGGFQYAPTCSITSVGATAYTTGTATSTAGPPATAVLTASSTALAASTSGFVFHYDCN